MDTHLPEEILFNEIFRRLPTKSLLACNCVCKLWHSIISSPYFASFHLKQSPFSNDHSLLINTKTCFLSFDFENYDQTYDIEIIKNTPTEFPEKSFSVAASCNGLVCLDDAATNSLYVWNPTTSKQIQVSYPRPLTKTQVVWGFGHVSSTEDYKIIRICKENFSTKVQVFSFISYAWKILDVEYEKFGLFGYDQFPPIIGTGVSVNDMIYWATYYTEYDVAFYDHCCYILGFDLVGEKFMPLTPLPEWSDNGFNDTLSLFTMEGCLCSCWKSDGGAVNIGMFKKDEAGKYSWTRLFHFDHGSSIYNRRFSFQEIKGVTKTGNFVVRVDGESIILLDTSQDPAKEVHLLKIPRTRNVITYVKSLLSPLNLVGLQKQKQES